MKKNAKKKTKNNRRWARWFFLQKKEKKENQSETKGRVSKRKQQELPFSKKKCKKKEWKKDFFGKRGNFFFQTIQPSGKREKHFLGEFSNKVLVKRDTFEKEKQVMKKEKWMIEKEGEVQKTNHFRSFVFEQRRQKTVKRDFAKHFFEKGSERQRKQETKRNKRDKQPKGWKKRQIKHTPK